MMNIAPVVVYALCSILFGIAFIKGLLVAYQVLFCREPLRVGQEVWFGWRARIAIVIGNCCIAIFTYFVVQATIVSYLYPEMARIYPRYFIASRGMPPHNVSMVSILVGTVWMIGCCVWLSWLPKTYRILFKQRSLEWIHGAVVGRKAKVITVTVHVVFIGMLVLTFNAFLRLTGK